MQGLLYAIIVFGAILNYECTAAPVNSTASNPTGENPIMYSYSEAVVEAGKPTVSQLTIVKGKDGEFHYAKNTNGNIKKGKWFGPLPPTPVENAKVEETVNNTMQDLTDELINPLKILQDNIGSSVQDFLLKALNF